MSTKSQLVQTALALIESYNKWDIEAIMAIRTPDCIQQILPKTLGRPEMDNATYKLWFGAMIPYFRNFNVTVDDIIEDVAANKVTLWAHSTSDSAVGPYANEYILILHMNEAGDKITKFFEFVDSSQSATFFPKLREFVAQNPGAEW
ncbi:putative SLAM family member 5 [Rosellinia necatrix]|uniref:Putative SLAM family member 5 n=1 Tax=Rosellinia necatrix TaxID=77044 RepID=A0A1W2THI6_ROSNE|nr:putative SLAM family member 5 [Rosellinia necatrix]